MILAGDIGGTKVELAVFSGICGDWKPKCGRRYRSRDHDGLEGIVTEFCRDEDIDPTSIQRAAFGIAGPVRNNTVHATNLPWIIHASKLSTLLGGCPVTLLNDLEANAWGIEALGEDEMLMLQPGASDASGNRVLVSAGTGLGVAGLHWNGQRHVPFPSEGGHADFSPRTELDFELFHHIRDKYTSPMDWERVLCGHAFVDIYEFLRMRSDEHVPEWLAEEMRAGDGPAAISKAGAEGRCAICTQTLELFVKYYGAATGDFALTFLALGGVYIGGGIAPKILDQMKKPRFLEAFCDKARMHSLLKDIPVHVILNPKTALLGSAVRIAEKVGASQAN